jgi:hypothetical protein
MSEESPGWRPDTIAVRAGLARSAFNETSATGPDRKRVACGSL